jgi:hypothetical protein
MVKRTRKMERRLWTAAAILALAATPVMADEGETWSAGGKGAATALVNVLYIPAKLVYATTGGLVGGLAYAVTAGDREVAQTIWEPSVGGNYIMTTDQLFPSSEGGLVESESSPQRFAESAEPQWPE